MKKLRIALTKGRLERDTIELFEKIGFDCENLKNKGRRLILEIPGEDIEVVLAKSADVITYVEHGACDIGVVGKDSILEYGGSYYEVADLGFGSCRFALAAKRNGSFAENYRLNRLGSKSRIASKYTNVTRRFFDSKGMDIDVIKIDGSVELAPLLGLADGIVDIVETGSTLKENGLEIIEEIANISARLIVNMVSLKLNKQRIESLILKIEKAIEKDLG